VSRSVEEWVGASDDAVPPPRVRLRVFERHGGICYLSGRKIHAGEQWELDHVRALCNGGENRESNLAPALKEAHRKKTASDVKLRAKDDRVRKKHLGIKSVSRPMPGSKASRWKKKLDGTVVERGAD
jgi:5-methylcytosine-specific restriction enzyme A